ncbi:protein-export chaperone SecB [Flavobacterium sp.]|jgi:preprotein translocase subunit SecB|uniref:protein-export chaperone SecB n=1 Tax=Flavobacterium sp. TaxID=239 RepID=UPI0022C1C592|nr:protein-export chaperone SecB [Flavobacterium sp.]MCZ8145835.1 protein-export chaperone SecB [Flavobacterium sp.]MCZ8366421.1 protein-export chaperone SecB [Flavobacterium sp.]
MLEAKRAEFKFVKFHIPRFNYNETRENQGELKMQFSPRGIYSPKEGKFELSISFTGFEKNKKRKPVISLDCVAEFIFTNKIGFEEIPDYFYTNSVAIVFPYLRSFISTVTLQANTGVIMLGVMNFMEITQPLKENTTVAESTI